MVNMYTYDHTPPTHTHIDNSCPSRRRRNKRRMWCSAAQRVGCRPQPCYTQARANTTCILSSTTLSVDARLCFCARTRRRQDKASHHRTRSSTHTVYNERHHDELHSSAVSVQDASRSVQTTLTSLVHGHMVCNETESHATLKNKNSTSIHFTIWKIYLSVMSVITFPMLHSIYLCAGRKLP